MELGRTGTVWAHTVQRFAPKSPPYVPPAEGFTPFAVGYVDLPDGVKVEAVLEATTVDDPAELVDARVTLVATEPVPRFATEEWLAARSASRGGGWPVSLDVSIIGAGLSRFGRQPGVTGRQLAVQAIHAALADAGITWPDVQLAFGGSDGAGSPTPWSPSWA